MLNAREIKNKKEFAELRSKITAPAKKFLYKNKKRILCVFILISLAFIFAFEVLPYLQSKELIAYSKITPISNGTKTSYLSEDAFRKIIGYNYGDDIYPSDTSKIREALERDDRIFGNVRFEEKFFPPPIELEVIFDETKPLFILQKPQESAPLVFSDKGKFYPYRNTESIPVVNAGDSITILLSTDFLKTMRASDFSLYKSISQITHLPRSISVIFNDVPFKTEFSSDSRSWKNAFRYYRQISRTREGLNVDSARVLNLRFSSDSLAYIE